MELTGKNYFSLEANQYYFSNSQYKGFLECPAKEMAKIRGDWKEVYGIDVLIGKYIHAWNEGTLERFKADNEEVFKQNGDLKSQFKQAEEIIEFMKKDRLLMTALAGEKERIFTAEMFGTHWKIVIDSYFETQKRFGDLKILKSLSDKFWDKETNCYKNVFEHRGYLTQMALYAEIHRLASNLNTHFEPFLVCLTKEKNYPDKAIISFVSTEEPLEEFISRELSAVASNMPELIAIKSGHKKPRRCESCDYCRSTKILTGTNHYTHFNLY